MCDARGNKKLQFSGHRSYFKKDFQMQVKTQKTNFLTTRHVLFQIQNVSMGHARWTQKKGKERANVRNKMLILRPSWDQLLKESLAELIKNMPTTYAFDPAHEKTNVLHMRKQRRRSASR